MKLRTGIRTHRDQKGDENCHLDFEFYLYNLLPEQLPADPQLPEKQLMMQNCSRYYDCRKKGILYKSLDVLPKRLNFAIDWINIQDILPPIYQPIAIFNKKYPSSSLVLAKNVSTTKINLGTIDNSCLEATHWCPLPELGEIYESRPSDFERTN